MKKFLAIALAALCLVGMTTTDAQAKKRSTRSKRSVQRTYRSSGLVGQECTMIGRCNVRTGPGENYSVIKMVPDGVFVYVHKQSGNWYYVTVYPNSDWAFNGWTHRQNLRRFDPADYGYY